MVHKLPTRRGEPEKIDSDEKEAQSSGSHQMKPPVERKSLKLHEANENNPRTNKNKNTQEKLEVSTYNLKLNVNQLPNIVI